MVRAVKLYATHHTDTLAVSRDWEISPPIFEPTLGARGPKGGVTKNSERITKGAGNVAKKTPKTKEDRIKKEKKRLNDLFKDLEPNKLKTCKALIERAAFITVSLEDVEMQLNETGFTEYYQNGDKQSGWKKSAAADVHISLTKNLNAIIKQLLDLVPAAKKKSKLEELMGE